MPILKPPASTHGTRKQFTQKTRKGKKAWRTNVDINDVQKGLEELGKELIQGGVIAEKASKDLFTIDTHGDICLSKAATLKGSQMLKADEIIAQRSSIPAVSIRKRRSEKLTSGIIEPKRQRTSYISHKEIARLREIASGRHNKQITEIKEASFDPWDTDRDFEDAFQDPRFSFLEKKKKKIAPITLKQKPISLAASGQEIPAVCKPDGAYSYNPLATDYTERLEFLGRKEVEAEKARIAAAYADKAKLEAATKSAAEAEAAEARADLSEWEEDSAWEGIESGTEGIELSLKRPERKTQAQRNKIKRRKEQERKEKIASATKKKNEQASLATKFARELDMQHNRKKLKVVDAQDFIGRDDLLELRRRKLGKIKLPEKNLELVLPDELQESLRLLKPEGNLLKERYRCLLLRGKIENRRPINSAKIPRRKVTEKWSYKDFVLH